MRIPVPFKKPKDTPALTGLYLSILLLIGFFMSIFTITGILKTDYKAAFSVFVSMLFIVLSLLALSQARPKAAKIILMFLFFFVFFVHQSILRSNVFEHYNKAKEYSDSSMYDLFIKESKKALSHPGYLDKNELLDLRLNLMWSYLQVKEWDSAYEQALKLWVLDRGQQIIKQEFLPKSALYQAVCFERKGLAKECKDAYSFIIRTFPSNHVAHYHLALRYFLDLSLEKAKYHIEEALRYSNREPEYYFLLARIYVYMGDIPLSVKEFETAYLLDSSNRNFLDSLCWAYIEVPECRKKAVGLAQEMVRQYPDFSNSYYRLARAYSFSGDYKNAFVAYKRAIRLAFRDTDIKFEMKELQERLDAVKKKQ